MFEIPSTAVCQSLGGAASPGGLEAMYSLPHDETVRKASVNHAPRNSPWGKKRSAGSQQDRAAQGRLHNTNRGSQLGDFSA